MADIWKEAGLSAGALYVHFKNKEDLVVQCMRFELTPDYGPPKSWDELKARMLDFNPRLGLDAAIITRARIHLRAGCVNPGERHDVMRQYLNEQIDTVAAWLEQLADAGLLRLRMSAHQTTAAICAHVDGMLWIALACDRPLDDSLPEIAAGLDHLVLLP